MIYMNTNSKRIQLKPTTWKYQIKRTRVGYTMSATWPGMPTSYRKNFTRWFPTLRAAHHNTHALKGPLG